MASNTSNFVVPLPPVVKVEVEEQVVPKDFRGYLTRALAWTALMPLFMLAFMHFSQLTHTAAVIDDQQIMRTQQFARSMSARFVSIETFLNTASDMISESIGSKVIPVSRLNKLAEKMPYLTSLKLISYTGRVDFHHGESSVSTAELMSAFAGSEVNVRSFQNEICFGSRVPEADSYDRSFLLIGCEPKEDIAAIFERSVGAEPYSLQIFDSKQKEIFFTSLNDSGNVRPQNLSPEFVKISEQMLGAPIPLWRTNQKRNDSAVLSIAEIPDTDWRVVFSQRVTFRDKQLLSSLLTSGVFLVCGALLALIVGTFLGFRLTNYVQTLIDQINAFKKDGSIKKPDRSFLANAPIELKLLSVQFEKLVRQVQSTQKKLEESNLDLTHQVNLRTRTLNQRNQELRALQFLLAPLQDEPHVVIKRTVESFRLILGLNQLDFVDKPERDRQDLASLPVKLSTGVLGYLSFERPDYTQENRINTSLQRLANSIAIVLENKEMFSSVKASQSRFNALLESMTEGVVLIGKTGSLLYSNKTAREILSIAPGDGIAKVESYIEEHFRKVYLADSPNNPQDFFAGPTRYVSKVDSDFFIEASGFLVPEFHGYVGPRMGLLLRDISEEVSMERMKRNLISVVAHELKTPVTTLRLQSETLQRQIRSGKLSDSQLLLTEMLEESERLQNLICDWLDVSRLEAGSLVIKPKVQTVTAILNKAMKSVHLHFPHLEVSLKVEPEAECVLADKDRMTQFFVNILENAARYNDKEKPTCNVRSEKIDDSVVISFSDNGIGVSEKHLSKIFDSFYQVDMGSGRKVGGTGLGLSICRGIMAAHGGKIWAEQNPKGGTVFKISLSL